MTLGRGKEKKGGRLDILQNKILWLLPCENVSAKMTVCAGFLVNGVLQVEALGNGTGSQIEILLHDFQQLTLTIFRCAVIKNGYR